MARGLPRMCGQAQDALPKRPDDSCHASIGHTSAGLASHLLPVYCMTTGLVLLKIAWLRKSGG